MATKKKTLSDDGCLAPNRIRRLLSKLCNIHRSSQPKAHRAHNRGFGAVKSSSDVRRPTKASAGKIREDLGRSKEKSISASRHRTTEKTPRRKDRGVARVKSAYDSAPRSSRRDYSSRHSDTTTAGDMNTADDEARLRQRQCIYFDRERVSDFTRGPIRIISASDGVDHGCAALLLNQRFSNSIRTALETHRELNDEIRATQQQDEKTIISFESIERSIKHCHSRREILMRKLNGTFSTGFRELGKELAEIGKEIRSLDTRKEGEAADQQRRHTCLHAHYRVFLEAQKMANHFLESAFVDARLLSALSRRAADMPTSQGRSLLHDQEYSNPAGKEDELRVGLAGNLERDPEGEYPGVRQLVLARSFDMELPRSTLVNGVVEPSNGSSKVQHTAEMPSPITSIAQHQGQCLPILDHSTCNRPHSADMANVSSNARADADALHHHVNDTKTQMVPRKACPARSNLKGDAVEQFMSRSNIVNGIYNVPNESSPLAETHPVQPSTRQVFLEGLRDAYMQARETLIEAEKKFDGRDDQYDYQRARNIRELQRSGGTRGMPQVTFDLEWFQHVARITRYLTDCEDCCGQCWLASRRSRYKPRV
jgi:hypothetical protein